MTERVVPEPPQFPAGPFAAPDSHDRGVQEAWIGDLERTPARLRQAVSLHEKNVEALKKELALTR